MDALHSQQMATILYALLFCIFYSEKLLYLAFCLGLGVLGGYELLEYAPAMFLPLELIIGVSKTFRRGFARR